MGFHKRFVTKHQILDNLTNLEDLLDADALILDEWSSNFIEDLESNPNSKAASLLKLTNEEFSSEKKDSIINYYDNLVK